MSGVTSQPSVYYFGAAGGKVNWAPVSDGQIKSGLVFKGFAWS